MGTPRQTGTTTKSTGTAATRHSVLPYAIVLGLIAGVIAVAVLLHFLNGRRQTQLTLSAGQPGGSYLPVAQSIARIIEREHPHIRINVVESTGGLENAKRIEHGQADLALVQNDTPGYADLTTIAPLYTEVLHILARRDARIQRLRDIRGKTIAVGPQDSGTEMVFRQVFQHAALTYEDFTPRFIGGNQAVDALLEDDVQAMVYVTALKSEACRRAIASGQVELISLGAPGAVGSEVEGFKLDYPFIEPATIPVMAYATPSIAHGGEPRTPVTTVGVRSILVARRELSAELVQTITASLHRHRYELVRQHPATAQMTESFDRSELQFPLHDGARDYYDRKEPSFLVTYAEVFGLLLSLSIAAVAVITSVRGWIHRVQKNRIDEYYLDLLEVLDALGDRRLSPDRLESLRTQLQDMQHTAYTLLVREKLQADDSFRIFQTMIRDCQRQVDERLERDRRSTDTEAG